MSQREDGVWDVVDGVQRLSTIFEFTGILRDKNGRQVPRSTLVGTEYLPGLQGRVWEDDNPPDVSFPNALRLELKRRKLDLKIVKKESDPNAKFDLFERLNTLGSQLSDQEVRNCLLVMVNVTFHEWLEQLSNVFVDTIGITERAKQERYDMELVLRFLILAGAAEKDLEGIKDVDDYITKAMRSMARDPSYDFKRAEVVFRKTFDALHDSLGPECFTRQEGGRGRGGFLISVFEVLAVGLGWNVRRLPAAKIDQSLLKQAYKKLPENPTFREFSTSGKSASSRIPRLVPLGRRLFKVL